MKWRDWGNCEHGWQGLCRSSWQKHELLFDVMKTLIPHFSTQTNAERTSCFSVIAVWLKAVNRIDFVWVDLVLLWCLRVFSLQRAFNDPESSVGMMEILLMDWIGDCFLKFKSSNHRQKHLWWWIQNHFYETVWLSWLSFFYIVSNILLSNFFLCAFRLFCPIWIKLVQNNFTVCDYFKRN